ncbi:hypothetical protein M9H77_06765 [Catharanthus roseus]|uniref:Uncharacterized protein n=1 Tax=Catharanthus roseus TaxID=4058 RepID=A0ACC0BT01_CATRO|nr:hypothetical protein M9H77_06765 [Catharanthus roseus]
MAESISGKSQVDIDALKEILCAQQKLLQKLYNELDAEREASSTAASEALSMILRLQGEKAAVQMEADQYKRMVEEKMCHAEESLAIFEDIMYQKEMEVASLDYQVQAYRHKLISMGCDDPGDGELKFPESLLQISETKAGEVRYPSLSRRNSAPMLLPPKHPLTKKGFVEKDRSLSPDRDLVQKDVEDCISHYCSDSDSGKKTDSSAIGDINSYWEEIRKLDERVKVIAGVSYTNLRSSTRSPSPSSQFSGSSYDLMKVMTLNEIDQVKHPGKKVDTDIKTECTSSPRVLDVGVLDVFEVPQNDKKNQEKMILQGEDKLQKPDSVYEEVAEASNKDDTDWLKRMLKSSHAESNLSSRLCEAVSVDSNVAMVRTTGSVSENPNRLHQLSKIPEIVQVESQSVRRDSVGRQEPMRLLNDIKEQLNSIQCDIRSLRPKKPSPRNELAFVTLKEEMLHFWL